mgnify:CR=1 FL=1
MFIRAKGSGCRGLESVEDQVSMDVRDVIQASESDLMARGVAIDLLQMANRVARGTKPPNTKICPGRKVLPWTASLLTIEGAIKPFVDGTVELSMKASMSVSKPADLG